MEIIAVGKRFWIDYPGYDAAFAIMGYGSFDVYVFSSKLQEDEISNFGQGKMRYGVTIYNHIPFFLVDIQDWLFEVTFNALAEKPENLQKFLENEGNAVHFMLIDEKSIVRRMRMIGLHHEVMQSIKEACFSQLTHFYTSEEVMDNISELSIYFSTNDLIREAVMHHASLK